LSRFLTAPSANVGYSVPVHVKTNTIYYLKTKEINNKYKVNQIVNTKNCVQCWDGIVPGICCWRCRSREHELCCISDMLRRSLSTVS